MQTISSSPSYFEAYDCVFELLYFVPLVSFVESKVGNRTRIETGDSKVGGSGASFLTAHNNYCVVVYRGTRLSRSLLRRWKRARWIFDQALFRIPRHDRQKFDEHEQRPPRALSETPWSCRLNINPDGVRYSGNNSGGDSSPVTSILIASSTCYRYLGEFHFGSEDSSLVLHPFSRFKRGNYRENNTRVTYPFWNFCMYYGYFSSFVLLFARVTSDWVTIFIIRVTQQIGLHTNVYSYSRLLYAN